MLQCQTAAHKTNNKYHNISHNMPSKQDI